MKKLTNKKIINTTYGKVTKEKGITLIALVITVIVLLILAGVTIATLTGDNGIITKATTAKEKTNIGAEKDLLALAYNSAVSGNYGNGEITKEQLQEELDNQGVDTTVTQNSPLKVTFNDSGNSYTIDDKTGEITGPTIPYNPEELTIGTEKDVKKTDKYGWLVKDYNVEYDCGDNLDQRSDKWRLFFQDSQYAYLITDKLVGKYKPSDYYDKEDKEKYKDGTKMSIEGQKLNGKVSSLFTDESKKANNNIRATVWFTDTAEDGPWAKYKNSDCVFAIASPTAELFEASYNNNTSTTHKNYENNKINVQLETYGYKNSTSTDRLKAEDSHGIYNKDNSSNWWLASPDYYIGFGYCCLIVGGSGRLFRQRRRRGQLHVCSSPYSLYSNIYIR